MRDYKHQVLCPFCGKHQTQAMDLWGEQAIRPPKEGDGLLCIDCGRVCIVTKKGARRPTGGEQAQLDKNFETQRVIQAWRDMVALTGGVPTDKPTETEQ